MFETGLPAIVLKNSLGEYHSRMEPATALIKRRDCVRRANECSSAKAKGLDRNHFGL